MIVDLKIRLFALLFVAIPLCGTVASLPVKRCNSLGEFEDLHRNLAACSLRCVRGYVQEQFRQLYESRETVSGLKIQESIRSIGEA